VNSGQKVKTLQGHTKNVNTVCWSPDGKYLASGSRDKTVIVWDANSGAILQTMKVHSFGVNCVSWSPDGKYLASASWDMSIVLWNPNNGRNLQTLKGHTFSVESLCWTPDGKYLISGAGDQTVRIWSKETEYIYIDVPFPDKKPVRDVVNEERDVVNEDSKPETGVETDQAQIEEPSKKVIKKSIERTRDDILIKEYDQQGNLIKITKRYTNDKSSLEFTLRDGKILSVKGGDFDIASPSVNKQENTANYWWGGLETDGKFNEFGLKEEIAYHDGGSWSFSYEYNEDGLLVKEEFIDHDAWESTLTKTTTTYTYDVMSQDWKKRTGTDDQGNKTVTTRTVEYW
jgi:YD repeat-containing protein